MTNQTTDSVELEEAREILRKEVQLGEDLEYLQKDERFQRVFTENFCKNVVEQETYQLVSQNELVREAALEKIKAARYFEAYIDYVRDVGNAAKAELLDGGE